MENEFLQWLGERVPASSQVALGIGDDAALLNQSAGKQTVVTTDMLMDGVDFHLAECGPRAAGRKALAANLSDLAAMGARPIAAFVSLALPQDGGADLARDLIEGLLPLAAEFDCPIAGGDTNSWRGKLAISITALGEVDAGRAWLRSGARPGDAILVTGAFGGSLQWRHLSFTPRVRAALQLQNMQSEIHAAIDVSDGLSLDLSRICAASGCGARIIAAQVPVQPSSDLNGALTDGEDFELILAVPPSTAQQLLSSQPLDVRLTPIGVFTEEPGMTMQVADGQLIKLEPRGWEHR
jgi:thiamine-monophosphate kinase